MNNSQISNITCTELEASISKFQRRLKFSFLIMEYFSGILDDSLKKVANTSQRI